MYIHIYIYIYIYIYVTSLRRRDGHVELATTSGGGQLWGVHQRGGLGETVS